MQVMAETHPKWQQFTNGLSNAIRAHGCDHTHEHTRALLEVLGFADDEIEASVTGFTEAGGFCDCEILTNLASPPSEPANTEPERPCTLDLGSLWVAEYSPQQGCLNMMTAREVVENNLRQIMGGWANGYIPFAICKSAEEASRACDVLTEAMLKRGGKSDHLGRIFMPEAAATAGGAQG